MKILFNCSTNIIGGAIQNSANFIKNASNTKKHEFVFIVSNQVKQLLDDWDLNLSNIICLDTPAKNKNSVKKILDIEQKYKPDLIYTMAGPAYVRFKTLHVMGISNPYITHADKLAFSLNRNKIHKILFLFKVIIQGLIARFGANFFIFQTETSRNGFCSRFFWPKKKTSIIPNAIGNLFLSSQNKLETNSKCIKVFTPSAYYPHKNLEIIIEICSHLKIKNKKNNFSFITTAPINSNFHKMIQKHDLCNYIDNIGPYSYAKALKIYEDCDCVFIPSILETFSTSYLEAIALNKPLVVSDKDFSREVCGNYAYYFDSLSITDALNKIESSLKNKTNQQEREKIIRKYGDQENRFHKIIKTLETVFLENKNKS